MNRADNYSGRVLGLEIMAVILGLLFLAPFYFILVNSVKTLGEILVDAASFPSIYHWGNFSKTWGLVNFPKVFFNSLQITVLSVAGIVLISAMTAYRLVRKPTVYNKILFTVLIASMIIPFQSVMLQLVRVTSFLELRGNLLGIVTSYLGFGLALSVFLFHGFIKTVPLEIEEAAVVDGCSPYGVFFRIVMPLLKPIIVTVMMLNCLWIWNDYLLPTLIIGGNKALLTIPLAITRFFGTYSKQWDMALPALAVGIAPLVVFFLFLQKYIVEGLTSGAVNG
jgi:raffinose/stachyose/melibiose transport system permease protein